MNEPLSIEDVLQEFNDEEADQALIELLAVELELRFRSSDVPSVEEYSERFTGKKAVIEPLFGSVIDDLMATLSHRRRH